LKVSLKLSLVLVLLAAIVALSAIAAAARSTHYTKSSRSQSQSDSTATPIKHMVVIFQENRSFDHYFGTYPHAKNPPGEPKFKAFADTPSVNGLNHELLTNNPNAANPTRIDRSETFTCDQIHDYDAEQKAFNHGLMDKFVENTSGPDCTDKSLVMDYFDGNTVTALWNYAQHFAMSDNYYQTVFGHSTPGHINLVSGQTHGVIPPKDVPADIPEKVSMGTLIGDLDPKYDGCSSSSGKYAPPVSLSGRNVGNLLNNKGVTWGWFQGGFKPTSRAGGKPVCGSSHKNIHHVKVPDYVPHHEPFQYYKSTANPKHLPPSSAAMIGKTDQANHQYDLSDFWRAADSGHLPAVSFLKAPAYQDGHAGYSDPLYEQHFLVDTINRLQKLPSWKSTAIIITKDDSGGWYDHQMGPIVNHSSDPTYDFLSGQGMCGDSEPGAYQDRCGYGSRLPLQVISPYAKQNFVDHSITDQTSVLRFIEDNWGLGRIGDQSFDAKAGSLENLFDFSHGENAHKLFLDPRTGQPSDNRR
jgi:phospholipase C